MYSIILVVHTLLAVTIVGLVLVQQGKGGVGALGGGAADTMFGSRGSFSFLSKITAVCVALFFATSLGLAIVTKQNFGSDISPGIIQEQQSGETAPADSLLPSFDEQPGITDQPGNN